MFEPSLKFGGIQQIQLFQSWSQLAPMPTTLQALHLLTCNCYKNIEPAGLEKTATTAHSVQHNWKKLSDSIKLPFDFKILLV